MRRELQIILGIFLLLLAARLALGTPTLTSWDLSANQTVIRLSETYTGQFSLRYEKDSVWVQTDTIQTSSGVYTREMGWLQPGNWTLRLSGGANTSTSSIQGNNTTLTWTNWSINETRSLYIPAPVATPSPGSWSLGIRSPDIGVTLLDNQDHAVCGRAGYSSGVREVQVRAGYGIQAVNCIDFAGDVLEGIQTTEANISVDWCYAWRVATNRKAGQSYPYGAYTLTAKAIGRDNTIKCTSSGYTIFLDNATEPGRSNASPTPTPIPLDWETSNCNEETCKILLNRPAEFLPCTAPAGVKIDESNMQALLSCDPMVTGNKMERSVEILKGKQICIKLPGAKKPFTCADPLASRVGAGGYIGGLGGFTDDRLFDKCSPPPTENIYRGTGSSEIIPKWYVGISIVCKFKAPVYLKVTVPGAGGGTGIQIDSHEGRGLTADATLLSALSADSTLREKLLKRSDWQINLTVAGKTTIEASTTGKPGSYQAAVTGAEVLGGELDWFTLLFAFLFFFGAPGYVVYFLWKWFYAENELRADETEGEGITRFNLLRRVEKIATRPFLQDSTYTVFMKRNWNGRWWFGGRSRWTRVITESKAPGEKGQGYISYTSGKWTKKIWTINVKGGMYVSRKYRLHPSEMNEPNPGEYRGRWDYQFWASHPKILTALETKYVEHNINDAVRKGENLAGEAAETPAPVGGEEGGGTRAPPPLSDEWARVLGGRGG